MIGSRLCELRKNHKMNQNRLAEKLSLSRFTISSYENGVAEASDDTMVRICKLYNVSADYMLGLIDTPLHYERSMYSIDLPPNTPQSIINDIREYAAFRVMKYKSK